MNLLRLLPLILTCSATTQSFLSITPAQNPLHRDSHLIPMSPDLKGLEASVGSLRFILFSTFLPNQPGSGKVWVLPVPSPNHAYVLITGLNSPTGICFDRRSHYLYVTDESRILQFTIDTDMKDRFILGEDEVATIYKGERVMDCWVDGYGNLYFLDSEMESIDIVGYLDLWSGFENKQTTLYRRSGNPYIHSPVALQVMDSSTIFYVNNANPDSAGLLNSVSTKTRYLNQAEVTSLVKDYGVPWGIAVNEEGVYYTNEEEVWRYGRKKGTTTRKAAGMGRPRGLCVSGDELYVADNEYGAIFRLSTGSEEDLNPEEVVRVPGVYEVYCLNS